MEGLYSGWYILKIAALLIILRLRRNVPSCAFFYWPTQSRNSTSATGEPFKRFILEWSTSQGYWSSRCADPDPVPVPIPFSLHKSTFSLILLVLVYPPFKTLVPSLVHIHFVIIFLRLSSPALDEDPSALPFFELIGEVTLPNGALRLGTDATCGTI